MTIIDIPKSYEFSVSNIIGYVVAKSIKDAKTILSNIRFAPIKKIKGNGVFQYPPVTIRRKPIFKIKVE